MTYKFSLNGKKKSFYSHRLVGIHFIENYLNFECVCHRLENLDIRGALDNSVDNLWWGTRSDNMKDMFNKGRDNNVLKNRTGSILGKGFNKKKIVQNSFSGEYISNWETIISASIKLGISSSSIVACCKGRRKTAGGFTFNYF